MKDKNKILGTVNLGNSGINLVVTNEGEAVDYCSMRAAQLSALTSIISGEGYESFKLFNENVQDNVLWLINELANEVKQLLPIVCLEEKTRTEAHFKSSKGLHHE